MKIEELKRMLDKVNETFDGEICEEVIAFVMEQVKQEEIKFLKRIRYGASYCWMNDEIDEEIKKLQGV